MKNYKLTEVKDLPHLGALGHLYAHESGAKVMYLKSEDTNKVFSVAFSTPPKDDTGLAHIMEHCVLGGSRKYPLKDPFMQLANGSLYTFLNAYTYPDKTIYPVASVNDVDFLNLMDVYLDAVFFPMVYERKHSFSQEGWHYQLESEEAELKYNGVVYNEMKGAYSDPYRLLYNALDKALYPDSTYGYESGGNPDAIPSICYEDFIAFHKKHYCPENALIFFYGDMDIEYCFKKLDEGYLSKFEKTGAQIEIAEQKALKAPVFVQDEYSIADEKELDQNYMAATYVFSPDMPPMDITGMKVLNYVLMMTPASPLYKAMVEANIGEDISGHFSQDSLHPGWGISMRNGGLSLEDFKGFLDDELAKIANEGLSQDFVTACLNFLEFQAKEEDFGPNTPKGLIYNIRALSSWLYGNCPWEAVSGVLHLEQIRLLCADGYLEGLIRKYILGNNHVAYAVINPVLNLDEAREEALRHKLATIKSELGPDDKTAIIEYCKELKIFQETPDPPELLELIPRLSVADIKKEIEHIPLEVKDEGGAKLLHAPLETNDIIYSTMIFDMSALSKEYLPIVSILQYILSKLATKNHDTLSLTQEIKGNLGGLGFSTDIITKNPVDFVPAALVSVKFLSQNTPKMFEIVSEILHDTLFDDKSQIKNYLLEMKAAMGDRLLTGGSSIALMRSMTYFSPAAAYQDTISGLGFYDFLKELCEDFDNRFEGLAQDLAETARIIYNKNHVQYSIVANQELYEKFVAELLSFHEGLPGEDLPAAARPPLIDVGNEGIATASKVQYCALAANFIMVGYDYSGGLKVLGNILDNYLYEEIRAKGGAYGCGSNFSHKGMMYFYSYRDPELEATYEIFRSAGQYIRNLDISDKEIEKYILGTIRAFDKPATNAHKGLTAASNYIQGWSDALRQKERDEVLSTDLADIRSFADLIEKTTTQNHICAVGGVSVLENSEVFDTIRRV
jgi:Zn-dependent M16 (insulinase) family peptidase